jgi:esterase/lipase superfamily enzyme
MELLIFGHGGERVIVFPTREGRFYDYENFGLVAALTHQIESGRIQLFCVDSVDSESVYAWGKSPKDRIARHTQYEQYILNEVIPLTAIVNSNPTLAAHGCSIGAWHAVNIAFRNPWQFQRVVALSGRYDLTQSVGNFPDLFGGHYDTDIYFHTPNHFIPNVSDPNLIEKLRSLRISLAVGEHDPFGGSNRRLSESLWEKGVGHSLDIWNGEAHRARYWRQMAPCYF